MLMRILLKTIFLAKGANPETISKNLAELKANKVSQINENRLYWVLTVLLI